jgi:hypothetical protein
VLIDPAPAVAAKERAVGGLSGGLRRNTDDLAVLGDRLMMPESEGFVLGM